MTTYTHLQQEFSKNSLGYSSLGIILSTCLGSIAIMTILMNGHGFLQMMMVFLTVTLCSIHNASIITVQKPSLIFNLLVLSTVVNTLLIIGNLL